MGVRVLSTLQPCGDEGYHEVPAADAAHGVVTRRDFCQVHGC